MDKLTGLPNWPEVDGHEITADFDHASGTWIGTLKCSCDDWLVQRRKRLNEIDADLLYRLCQAGLEHLLQVTEERRLDEAQADFEAQARRGV